MSFFRLFFLLILTLLSQALSLNSAVLSHQDLTSELKLLAQENPNFVRYNSIGKTVQGRDIWSLAITNFDKGNAAEKSAICIVANLSGTYLSGTHVALETARSLLAQSGKQDSVTQLLNQRIFYFIPVVNADAAERYFQQPLVETAKNLTPVDEDFDVLKDEDGPEDLNGDGFITQMRIPDVKGKWREDTTDARLLQKVAPDEIGEFRLQTEGIDNDGDELINEDPPGGVNLNMNFPHAYQQYEPATGPFMLSEPEARAVVKFFMAHPNIVFTIIYDAFDNLLVIPKTAKNDNSAPKKVPDKIAAADAFIYRKVSEIYRKSTQLKLKPELKASPGSLSQWLYFQYGVPAFCVRPWWPVVAEDSSAAEVPDTKKSAAQSRTKQNSKPANSTDFDWLKWVDHTGQGFVAWQPFEHPQLGAVEIGGFRPFLKTVPPEELLANWTTPCIDWTLKLSHLLPGIQLSKVEIEKQEKSVFLLKVEITKTGFLPVTTAFAHEKHLVKSTLARIQLNGATLLGGTINVDLPRLVVDGQTETVEWLLFAPKTNQIDLEILTEKAGKIRKQIRLK